MKISKLFHWLYTILMFLPFVALLFNFARIGLNGSMDITSFNDVVVLIQFPLLSSSGTLSNIIRDVYSYLVIDVFGIVNGGQFYNGLIINCLTYWTCISIIYLIFDVVMYVPLLAHRWLDKGMLE